MENEKYKNAENVEICPESYICVCRILHCHVLHVFCSTCVIHSGVLKINSIRPDFCPEFNIFQKVVVPPRHSATSRAGIIGPHPGGRKTGEGKRRSRNLPGPPPSLPPSNLRPRLLGLSHRRHDQPRNVQYPSLRWASPHIVRIILHLLIFLHIIRLLPSVGWTIAV